MPLDLNKLVQQTLVVFSSTCRRMLSHHGEICIGFKYLQHKCYNAKNRRYQ